MLSRANVSSKPHRIIKADRPLDVRLWVATFVGRGMESDQAFIANTQKKCTPALGTPMPDPGSYVDLELHVGEELWAVSESVALFGVEIRQRR